MHSSRSMSLASLAALAALALLSLARCDDPDIYYAPETGSVAGDASLDAATDAGTATDAPSSDAAADGAVDAADAANADAANADAASADAASADASDADSGVNGCTTFVDRSGPSDTREVDFPTDSSPAQYTPSCIQIAAGQTVTFVGSFIDHPLDPFGGDANSPITSTSSGASAPFVFPTAGTYGFHCAFHPGIMFGAVLVQ